MSACLCILLLLSVVTCSKFDVAEHNAFQKSASQQDAIRQDDVGNQETVILTAKRMLLEKLLKGSQTGRIEDATSLNIFGLKVPVNFFGFPSPYLAKPGDSVHSLSTKCGISVESFKHLNTHLPRSSEDVPEGMALNIPGWPAVPPLPTAITTNSKDELTALCAAYQISEEDLRTANPEANLSTIDKLTKVHLPCPNAHSFECPEGVICIRQSVTLTELSAQHGVEVEQMFRSNPHLVCQNGKLYCNQVLNEPGVVVPKISTNVPLKVLSMSSIYDALLVKPGVPICRAYLNKLVQLNNDQASVEDVVQIPREDQELQMGGFASADEQGSVSDAGIRTRADRPTEWQQQESLNPLSKVVPAPLHALQTTIPRRELHGRVMYGRRLISNPDRNPVVRTRLHSQQEPAPLPDDDSQVERVARRLRALLDQPAVSFQGKEDHVSQQAQQGPLVDVHSRRLNELIKGADLVNPLQTDDVIQKLHDDSRATLGRRLPEQVDGPKLLGLRNEAAGQLQPDDVESVHARRLRSLVDASYSTRGDEHDTVQQQLQYNVADVHARRLHEITSGSEPRQNADGDATQELRDDEVIMHLRGLRALLKSEVTGAQDLSKLDKLIVSGREN